MNAIQRSALGYRSVVLQRFVLRGSSGRRHFTIPAGRPLDLLKDASERRRLCNKDGFRTPNKHWVFQISVSPSNPNVMAPVLRTVGFQRVGDHGIDFIMKRGVGSALLSDRRPASMLYTEGHYLPGEHVEQWRADGHCDVLDLHEVFDNVSHATITGMIGSKRAAKEAEQLFGSNVDQCQVVSKDRQVLPNHSHFIELVQNIRLDLENGDISNEEIEDSVQAYRFYPNRMERMIGSPDQVVWDRWEWMLEQDGKDWKDPVHLLPY
uniref:Uncharacterized protein n=1 Tax=Leptocylindrus danicus TaxID=163516 RepID=A0A7S2KDZ2_9STRA|mmetsp:Transcript_21778/g.32552  ORF Transcript_21778/g.32552 Transcript_21778/m.32552 type:complete len:265 (+) Transcript_21778:83-877(+)